MSKFQKATRKQLKLRLALVGPTGAGKTKTALLLAAVLGKRIAVIDTENRSASKYVGEPGVPEFDVCELDSYAPRNYVEAIKDAEREGYDVIIVDGITQAWSGKDGALEMVDKAAKRSQSGNSFTAWRDVTPHHNALVEALVQCKSHLIVTMRAKMEYVLEEDSRGKKTPRKVGMAPIQREGMEYELDVVGDLDVQHNLYISKTRCSALDEAVIHKPGRELAETLLKWLGEGEAAPDRPLADAARTGATSDASRQAGTQTTSNGTTGVSTTTSATSEPRDIDWWQSEHNGLCDRAFQKAGIVCGPLDVCGLHVPSMDPPKFSVSAKKYAGVAFNDDRVPAGYLRKVIFAADNFASQRAEVRLWVSYLVARHEIRKLAAADIAAEQTAAEAALAEADQADFAPAADGEAAQ